MTTISERLAISVVICAYTEDRWVDLCAAVGSLQSQTHAPDEIILVIDHCPALYERAQRQISDVLVLDNSERRGLSGARNVGLRAARGDVVAFLDDDAAASEDWLASLAHSYDGSNVLGVGGLVKPQWVKARPTWFPPEFDWVIGCSHAGMPAERALVRNFVGANMSFRREALLESGGFRDDLGRRGNDAGGCEETELCLRASTLRPGALLVYQPHAEVVHRVPPERGSLRYFLRRCLAEGKAKALVTRVSGRGCSLDAERTYVANTLARAMRRALGSVVHGRWTAGLRLVAMLGGLTFTTLGYGSRSVALTMNELVKPRQRQEDLVTRVPPETKEQRAPLALFAPLALALLLWIVTVVRGVRLQAMSDLGLVSALPWMYWVALVALCCGFVLVITRRPTLLLVGAYVVVLLLVLHGTPAILYSTLRYSWAWKHVAITDYVIAHHGVDVSQPIPALVAYQDWPGFFTLNALLTSAVGLHSAISYAAWGPLFNELLYACPLWLIFRTFTDNRRIAYGSLWIFYLGNWIGQDYFSPQGLDYFLYLVVIFVCLRYFLARRSRASNIIVVPAQLASGAGETTSSVRAMYGIAIVLIAALVSIHQLTPIMLISALVLLTITRLLTRRSLPLVAVGLAGAWVAIAGRSFVAHNIQQLVGGFGHIFSNSALGQINGAYAASDQIVVSDVDRLLTGLIVLLGVVGVLVSWRRHVLREQFQGVVLIVAPAVALAVSNYGSEIDFRVYLFALPFLAYFAMVSIDAAWRRGNGQLVLRAVLFCVLAVGFVVSYDGKERANYFPPAEVSGYEQLFHVIPTGSYVTGIVDNDPWPLSGYNRYTFYWFSDDSTTAMRRLLAQPVQTLVREMGFYRHSYLVFTSSQAILATMTGLLPPGSYGEIEHKVVESGRFGVVEDNANLLVLSLDRGAPTTAPPSVAGSAVTYVGT